MIELKENSRDGKQCSRSSPGARKPPDDHAEARQERVEGALGLALPRCTRARSVPRANGSIVLNDYDNGEVARYNFTNGWVSKVTMHLKAARPTRC